MSLLREELKDVAGNDWRYQLVDAQINLVQGDTATAKQTLVSLNQKYPLNVEVLKTLGAFYRTFEMDFDGFYLFYNVTQVNTRNSDLWYDLAYFAARLGQAEDAGFCALKAIEFQLDEQRKIEIGEEFSDFIDAYSE